MRSRNPEVSVVCQVLREARVAARLTQAELAKRLGAPQSFVSKYESGNRRIDVLQFRRIALALNSSLATLASKLEKRLDGAE